MKIESLGHVVIKVRDQARSEKFYNGILGLPIVARLTPDNPPVRAYPLPSPCR